MYRRQTVTTASAALALTALRPAWAQGNSLSDHIAGLDQLQSLQVHRGTEVIFCRSPARSEGYFGALMELLDGPVLALA